MLEPKDLAGPSEGGARRPRRAERGGRLARDGSPYRWWPALVIVALAVLAVIWIRLFFGVSHQQKNIATANAGSIALLLLLLWCLFFSRLRWTIRVLALFGAIGAIGLTATLFRIRGVTGDLVPVLEWRWQKPRSLALSVEPHILSAQASEQKQPLQSASDYPQFLGPNRTATLEGPRLARDWKAQPPVKLWLQPIGAAWSGFAVASSRAITQEQRGEQELVVCYDLFSGKVIWSHADDAHYQTTIAGEGPRATPTIAGHRVYTLGATGILNCLDLQTGQSIWSKNIVQDNQSHVNEWGMSCSPLIVGDLVVVSAGGHNARSLVAYRAATGEFVWGGGHESAGYSSPRFTTLAGVPQILIFNSSVVAHDVQGGKVLWKYPWPGGHPHVSMPIVLPGDCVLVSSGYGTGSELLRITQEADGKFSASRVWKTTRLKAKFANLVYRDGYIYGLDDGIMVCLDASNGAQNWKEGRYGHGQEILVGDLLLVMAESGEVILMDPVPQEPRELTRFTALNGKTWNPPALAGAYLLVRNDKEAACYQLAVVKQ